jgi:tetratricopeptide (TPR) repeat protein
MDARLRNLARWKLAAVPLGIILLLLLAYGAWSVWKRRPDPEMQRLRAEAMALISQDDAASLARAVELLDAIQQGDHASSSAAGERGLALALLAVAVADEAEPLGERLAAASAEKARLEREQPPGFEDAQRALAMEVTRLGVELSQRRQDLLALRSRAAADLKGLAVEAKGAADAARGQGVLAVLDSNTAEVRRTSALLRAAGPDDWADLVELWLAVRGDEAARDQAIPRLVALSSAHPELVRARFVLARALVSAGRREEAISTVGRLLAANPRHERAQRLRSQLVVAPSVQLAAPPPPPEPVQRPLWIGRPPPQPLAAAAAANVASPAPPPPPQPVEFEPVSPPAETPAPPLPPAPKPRPRPQEPTLMIEPTDG